MDWHEIGCRSGPPASGTCLNGQRRAPRHLLTASMSYEPEVRRSSHRARASLGAAYDKAGTHAPHRHSRASSRAGHAAVEDEDDGDEAVPRRTRSRRTSRRDWERRERERLAQEFDEPEMANEPSDARRRERSQRAGHRPREVRRSQHREHGSQVRRVRPNSYLGATRAADDRERRASRRSSRGDMFVDAQEDLGGDERRRSRPSSRQVRGSDRAESGQREPRERASRSSLRQSKVMGAGGATFGAAELTDRVDGPPASAQQGDDAQDDIALAARDPPRSSRKRNLAPVPGGQVNTVPQGRMFPFTGIDNLGLLMEDDTYQPVCFSIYMFRTTLDYRTVREFFEVLLQLYPKYRYVVDFRPYSAKSRDKAKRKEQARRANATEEEKEALRHEDQSGNKPFNHGPRTWYSKSLKAGSWMRPAQWRIDDDFHVSENINVMSCGGNGDDAQLYRIAGRFLSRHFDFNKPVWEALLVQGLNTAEGAKSALMIKIHHSFSDGQGMIQSYHAALTALHKGMGIKEVQQWVDIAKSKEKAGKDIIKPTFGGTVSHSLHTVRELYLRKRKSFVYKQSRTPRSTQRLYCHSDGISMDRIKKIREAFSTGPRRLTLNDVAIAILGRAMRTAAEELFPNNGDKRAAIFVPISRRPPGNWELFNFTTGAIAWIEYPDPRTTSVEEQLAHVQKQMVRMKKSYLPTIWFKTFDAFCKHRAFYLPNFPGWHQFFYRAFSEYHVATNVPGPTQPVAFGKHEAYSYHVLPPSSPGKATMAIGMISYASDFSLAVSCDDVPEFRRVPETLCRAFEQAATAMSEAAERKRSTST